tara:strand:+ start:475 stop:1188 length:714 start_codon:yes stop_codon:yes gene_type:complete
MALPQLNTVNYDMVIPSTGQQVKYRPFVVREEKVLLTSLESGDAQQITNAMRDIVEVCTFKEVNVKKLAMFDLEYIFLKLRSKSVGENADIVVKCKDCEAENAVRVNLDLVELKGDPRAESTIQLTDSVGVSIKYPTVERTEEVMKGIKAENQIDLILGLMVASIDSIYDAEKVYPSTDSTPQELMDFIESLNKEQFNKFETFFEQFPKLKEEIEFTCEKCGKENTRTLEGLNDFFG